MLALITAHNSELGGNIRTFPSDFIVEEVLANRLCTITYSLKDRVWDQVSAKFQREKAYLHFTLIKTNWETIRALNYIRRKLGVSLKRFGISGMKDKRAITAQRVSIWKVRRETMARLKLHDMVLKNFEYVDDRITLGNAIGNRFTITIRAIPRKKREITDIVTQFRKKVATLGIPNYYGPQRTGGANVEVGRALKNGELKRGVKLILEKVTPYLAEGGITTVPKVFWYEKKMLQYLAKHPNDNAGALRKIPKKILTLYLHAYQSHLFNEKLQKMIRENHVPEVISIPGFNTPYLPELRTVTVTRKSHLRTKSFQILRVMDGEVVLRFTLGKGEYASTFLATLMN